MPSGIVNRTRAGSLSVFDDEVEQAASMVAQCAMPHGAIARKMGISRPAFTAMLRDPDFMQRVQELRSEYRQAVKDRGITELLNRVAALDDLWKRARQVIEERACDPDIESVPGGSSGLLVRSTKTITRKDGSQVVIEEIRADVPLMKEIRALSKQAAQELGQWVEQHDVTSASRPVSLLAHAVIVPAMRIADTPAHALDPPASEAHAPNVIDIEPSEPGDTSACGPPSD